MFSIKKLITTAKNINKTIVFPEAELSSKTLAAAEIILKKKAANVILLGDPDIILSKGNKLMGATIINPKNSDLAKELEKVLCERKKELTQDQAKELIAQPVYFAALMIECGYANGSFGEDTKAFYNIMDEISLNNDKDAFSFYLSVKK